MNRASQVLWSGRARPTRGPKPALDLDRITDAGIAVADADGLPAVTMQRVAADLGYTKMSLYRYVPGKAELVALMVERAAGEPPPIAVDGWRDGLTEWSRRLLDAYLRHPWTLEATVGPRPVGPNELGWMEAALAILAGTALTGGERLDTLAVLTGQVRMIAAQAAAARDPEAALLSAVAEPLREHGHRYPALVATLAEVGPGTRDQAFAFGLDRILDGVQALISGREGS